MGIWLLSVFWGNFQSIKLFSEINNYYDNCHIDVFLRQKVGSDVRKFSIKVW